MTFMVTFKLDADPVGKHRARYARRGNFVQTYTPDKTRTYESLIKEAAKEAADKLFREEQAAKLAEKLKDPDFAAKHALKQEKQEQSRAQMDAFRVQRAEEKKEKEGVLCAEVIIQITYH